MRRDETNKNTFGTISVDKKLRRSFLLDFFFVHTYVSFVERPLILFRFHLRVRLRLPHRNCSCSFLVHHHDRYDLFACSSFHYALVVWRVAEWITTHTYSSTYHTKKKQQNQQKDLHWQVSLLLLYGRARYTYILDELRVSRICMPACRQFRINCVSCVVD